MTLTFQSLLGAQSIWGGRPGVDSGIELDRRLGIIIMAQTKLTQETANKDKKETDENKANAKANMEEEKESGKTTLEKIRK